MTSSDPRWPYRLFEGVGVELEYMIVDAETLSVRPIADQLIEAETGEPGSDAERGPIAWSNELALHVIELKSQGPAKSLAEWPARFQGDLAHIDELLGRFGARLMPSGMHPWMNPDEELRLWPHECGPIYQTFHRIFDCRGHGWSNLQSTHLNLPFSNAGEFAQLHAAIRVLLPILPALTASTPVFDGRLTERKDNRLAFYSRNARRVPSVTGRVVPEPVDSPESYERDILQRIYRDLAPHDPEGTLRHEWANARGAIARFERGAIEIRIL
ncbi:MAG: glutamate-cysteine ligase family protein, partial [Planctomycetota bacterium]